MSASSTALAIDRRYSTHRRHHPPSTSFIHSIFNFTVKTAARTLVSISSANSSPSDPTTTKWGPTDHLRFVFMLTTWLALWFLRVLMDHFPSFCGATNYNYSTPLSYQYQLHGGSGGGGGGGSMVTDVVPYEYSPLLTSSSSSESASVVQSTLSALLPSNSVQGSMDIVLHQGAAEPCVDAIGRALTHTLGLLSEIPATSRKYQFTLAMADRIMDENARDGHVELLHINRVALSTTFARTSALLHRSLQRITDRHKGGWPTQVAQSLPLGSYIVPYVKGVNFCLAALLKFTGNGGGGGGGGCGGLEEEDGEVVAEKLAQELLWIATKMRDYGVVDEALQQWSFASGLASASLAASPRVQGFVIKTFAVLFGELVQDRFVAPQHVKFGMLLLWIPLCCHSSNGLSYPILTRFEKVEIERAMDAVIDTLPYTDQELILTNWLQDYAVSISDWPNLQAAYDRWCHCSRKSV